MKKPRKNLKPQPYIEESDSDETFQYIAGYTEGGAPFGVTWEEAKLLEERENRKILLSKVIMNEENPVNLTELIDAFIMQSDFLSFYVNKRSGEIASLTDGEIAGYEDEEGERNGARDILVSDDFIDIPSRWELNRYELLEDFVFSLVNQKIQTALARAIKGKGAFGRFHSAIKAHKIEKQWYEYEHEQLKEKAIEWCNRNCLVFNDSPCTSSSENDSILEFPRKN